MIRIGLIADTHSFLDQKFRKYFKDCDQIWHAGDFGSIDVSDELAGFKQLTGVYGNIDGAKIRTVHPLDRRFGCEGVDVWMTHIGGYPGRYNRRVLQQLKENPPNLFICGHSHILKVIRDPRLNNMLVMNPGAAGVNGFHKIRTLLRFSLSLGIIGDVEAIELGPRSIL